ncbi:hypothetical protein [Streptomyces tailanensis]|uniref:hypothetical protein n=1 Tax=Streptomyces tailanensis TaxID=2569858 RepID=UPI00122E9094|nr:hypothetical protein [Streptomyces tailanensis]
MTQAAENRIGTAATVESLTAEAAELATRVKELRQDIVDLDERIEAASDALRRLSARPAKVSRTGDLRGRIS